MDITLLLIIFGIDLVLIWVIADRAPFICRSEMLFSVTVPADIRQSTQAKQILHNYRRMISLVTIIFAGCLAYAWLVDSQWLMFLSSSVHMAAVAAIFFMSRIKTKPLGRKPTSVRVALLSSDEERTLPGNLLIKLGPFILIAITVVILILKWDLIPDRMIIHWDSDWKPNGWADKSFEYVFGLPLLGAMICAMLPIHSWALMNWSRTTHREGDAVSAEVHRRRTVVEILLYVEYLTTLIFLPLCFTPFAQTPQSAQIIFILVLSLTIFTGLGLLLWIVIKIMPVWEKDRGSETAETGESPIGDRTEDKFWKWGVFYINSDDPVVYIEKRFGLGYTLNLARPETWLLFLLTFLPPVVLCLILFL